MHTININVTKTARICFEGELNENTEEVWMVIHGYGQLATYFIKHFTNLLNNHNVIVAPEALSRFYLDGNYGRVGATWMTKEERLDDIKDYTSYLSQVYDYVVSRIGHSKFKFVVLGFSQGTATACRWVAENVSKTDVLICWAGFIPPDLNLENDTSFSGIKTYVVTGDKDQYVTAESIKKFEEIIDKLKIHPIKRQFDGGHEINSSALLSLAEEIRNM